MVIDYSEKRPGGVRDSVERKPVQKNRPRKEPVGIFALLSVVVLTVTFGAGVGTGWLIAKKTIKPPAPVVAAQPVKKDGPAQTAPADAKQPAPDAQLTFYKTLPAGGKAAIGSGLNLKKPEPVAAAKPAAPAASPAPAAEEKEQTPGHYTVQLASYRDKQEAETALGKLTAKGVPAFIVESKLAEKGIWYRIRVGKGLGKGEADELAAKTGKGALVLQE